MRPAFWLLFLLPGFLSSCGLIRHNPKYTFADGIYSSTSIDKGVRKVYVDYEGEHVLVYPLRKTPSGYQVDTATQKMLKLKTGETAAAKTAFRFRQNSLDLDFLTIPFKYRFRIGDFPRQFTTTLNGAVYLGYRSDSYRLRYTTDVLGKTSESVTRAGFSLGLFTGLGGTAMNPWVTNNAIGIEYDGVVWSKGVAAIIGLNNFTTGFALGWDHLADRNQKFWIYQTKPWVGFVFGLNLN